MDDIFKMWPERCARKAGRSDCIKDTAPKKLAWNKFLNPASLSVREEVKRGILVNLGPDYILHFFDGAVVWIACIIDENVHTSIELEGFLTCFLDLSVRSANIDKQRFCSRQWLWNLWEIPYSCDHLHSIASARGQMVIQRAVFLSPDRLELEHVKKVQDLAL